MNQARYEIGQEYFFIDIEFDPTRLNAGDPYPPLSDLIKGVQIKKLTCTELRRIPSDESVEICDDLFGFVDKEGVHWDNRYPLDYRVWPDTPTTQERTDLLAYMEHLLYVVQDFEQTPDAAKFINNFYKNIDEKLRTEYQVKAVNVGSSVKFTDGRPDMHTPKVPKVQIVPIDQEIEHIEY